MSESAARNPLGLGQGPLARQQLLQLTRGPKRRTRTIPFKSFQAERYAPGVLALAADQYGALARGERSAVGLFARIAAALDTQAAPREFVLAATEACNDEARHAQYCEELAVRCGFDANHSATPLTPTEPELRNMIELDVAMLRAVAISETLAAALLMACRTLARDATARALLGTLIADEVHHARLGWYYAAQRAPQWSRDEHQFIANEVAAAVVRIEPDFRCGRDAAASDQEAAHALGILDSANQQRCIRDVIENEIRPGLLALGIDVSAS